MTYEKAIKEIKEIEKFFCYNDTIALYLAENALERQIKKVPMLFKSDKENETIRAKCLECGQDIPVYAHYCHYCGQALDWGSLELLEVERAKR